MHRIFLITVALALLTASPASAITPPPIDPGALPPDVTGPDQPTEQRVLCASPTTLPGSGFHDPPWSNTYLGVADAHKFATGAGVTVAVIDTGVDASPRVPAEPGGDFVDQAGNGLSDCDAHGTLTASIIAGRPAPTDGFVGVAPDARLLSLRQTSEAFEPVGSQANPNDPNATPAAGSIRSLARAVVHAANLGVGVINISEAACYKVSRPIDETSLGASIDYAVNVKGVVVVVAAGNTGGDCVQNPAPEPVHTRRPTRLEQCADRCHPGVVRTAGVKRRRYRPDRDAQLVLDARTVGGRGRARRKHRRARRHR